MFEPAITYTDFNGEERTEVFSFHLTKENIVELNLGPKGGLENYLREIIESQDGVAVIENMRKIVRMAVGYRTEDGKYFRKDPEYAENFIQSDAYSEMFLKLISDAEFAAEFINKTVPKGLNKQLASSEKKYTDEDLLAMSDAEFDKIAGTNIREMSRHHLGIAMKRKTRVG